MLLDELRFPAATLPGIGKARESILERIGVRTVADLLQRRPRDYEDRRTRFSLGEVRDHGEVNTTITVTGQSTFRWRRGQALKVSVTDGTGEATLLCYGRYFLARTLLPGERFRIFGKFLRHGDVLESSSFSVERLDSPHDEFGRILPVYSLSDGLTQRILRRAVKASIDRHVADLEEELPDSLIASNGLFGLRRSIAEIHYPETIESAELARRSLAYRELFYIQLTMRRRTAAKWLPSATPGSIDGPADGSIVSSICDRLPFELTRDQASCIEAISKDLAAPRPMMRLLQGDVGSGKTLVGLAAAALSVADGKQVAIMVPTELLARQQSQSATRILGPLGLRVGLLTGSLPQAARESVSNSLADGELDVVVGTHALFSRTLSFRALGLVIIDEQHRFGVLQRLSIVEKGLSPDLLLMSATPIPRSLALTVFGDLDVSTIVEMPKGRVPIRTHLALRGKEKKVYDRVREELEAGHQAYFVYPLIAESSAMDVRDAEGMYIELSSNIFPDRQLALVHSRLAEEEKIARMAAFVRGEIDILVATSVVEVGVDVPNATCMVVEHAERFGLATLHQLRGRVGRSRLQSYAFLIYDSSCTETAKRRLMIMKETTDGFEIAEEDLRLRGPGELSGPHQTGGFELSFASISEDIELLAQCRDDVIAITEHDAALLAPENARIREVLTRSPPFSDLTAQAG